MVIWGNFTVNSCGVNVEVNIQPQPLEGLLFIKTTGIFETVMSWRKAYEYYSKRKDEAHKPIREDPLFQQFREILEWRMSQGV